MADLAATTAAFGQLLHAAGVPVTPAACARFAQAVVLAAPTTLDELAWLGRTTLLTDRAQREVFDRVFDQVFRGLVDVADFRGQSSTPPPPASLPAGDRSPADPARDGEQTAAPQASDAAGASTDAAPEDDEPAVLAALSRDERLATTPFAACTPEELALIAALVERLPLVPPLRRVRRRRRDPRGSALDLRATLRASHRTAGDPVHRTYRRSTTRARRVVLLADVSGSMEPYARVYLHLARGAVRALGSEAFVFATRLTRLTRLLGEPTPDAAYARVAEAAPDWSGGTRIGDAVQTFVDDYGRRGMARGAVVVIVSDGWETGDPAVLGRAMAQLSRLAFHVIWVNPRKAARGYEPLVAGMGAALPYVDTFVSGHSLRALEEVLAAIASAAGDPAPPAVRGALAAPAARPATDVA